MRPQNDGVHLEILEIPPGLIERVALAGTSSGPRLFALWLRATGGTGDVLTGMIAGLRANWPEALPLALCLLVFPIPYYITHTALRYRHPIDPLVLLLAAIGVDGLWQRFARKSGKEPEPETSVA